MNEKIEIKNTSLFVEFISSLLLPPSACILGYNMTDQIWPYKYFEEHLKDYMLYYQAAQLKWED